MNSEDIFSQTAEIAVLSLLLKDRESLDRVSDIKPEIFSSLPNRNLFSIILNLYSSGYTPDYSLVVTSLKSRNIISEVGGESYIQYLFSQNYDINNLDEYVRVIIDSFKTRKLMNIYGNFNATIASNENIDKIISGLKDSLEELDITGSLDTVYSMDNAVESTWEVIKERAQRTEKISVTTGVKLIDGVTGGYGEGDLWVIAGRPGMGKSSYICNSILSGVPSLIFSLEMSKETIVQRLLSIQTGIPVFNIRTGMLGEKELNVIGDNIESLGKYPIYIDSKYFITPEYVSSTIRKYVKNNGVKVVYIDYIQLLIERSLSATHDIGRVTRELKLLSNDLGITTVICSQLNRLVEMREDKRPILSDLRQSGNIEEDVDVALFLYRDEMYNPNTKDKGKLEYLLRKQRNGPTGVLYGLFDSDTNKMHEEKK